MKKRLLISSVLMSAVLACALGTGTYAWYAATEGSFVKGTLDSATISAVDNAYRIGNITINVDLTDPSGSVKLSDTDGYSYVLVGGAKTRDTTVAQNDASMYGTTTVSVSAETTRGAATADELKAIAGTYTITITATDQAKISLVDGAGAIAATKGNEVTVTFTISDAGVIGDLSKSTVYFAMQGDAEVENADTNVPSGTVKVSNLVKA